MELWNKNVGLVGGLGTFSLKSFTVCVKDVLPVSVWGSSGFSGFLPKLL